MLFMELMHALTVALVHLRLLAIADLAAFGAGDFNLGCVIV
jgi:hypothetical protein